MKFINALVGLLAVSCSSILVSARSIDYSTQLEFPETEENTAFYLSSQDKNDISAKNCVLELASNTIDCDVKKSNLHIRIQKMGNHNNCDTNNKKLTEVKLLNFNGEEVDVLGNSNGELSAHRFTFKLNDDCEFFGTIGDYEIY